MENKTIAEEATGIRQVGELQFWSEGKKITPKQAKKLLYQNKEVSIPQAGAGSYDEVFSMLGFIEVKVICWSSSAGGWQFGVKDKTGWRVAGQDNRYPYNGFNYWIDIESGYGFESFDSLVSFVSMG